MNYYLSVLMRGTVFRGRARRAEYWYFFLFNIIIIFVLHLIEYVDVIAPETYDSVFVYLYQVAVIVPYIAVGVRRMHDVNKSGWFILFPIYNLVLAVTEGTKGENKYGPDPKEVKVN
jgi:uncharacterized membrane protein YhaH (DUF805 family)